MGVSFTLGGAHADSHLVWDHWPCFSVCLHVCDHLCVGAYKCACDCTLVCKYASICLWVGMCLSACLCLMCLCVRVYVCVYCLCVCIMHVFVRVSVCGLHVCVCVSMSMCLSVCIPSVRISMCSITGVSQTWASLLDVRFHLLPSLTVRDQEQRAWLKLLGL